MVANCSGMLAALRRTVFHLCYTLDYYSCNCGIYTSATSEEFFSIPTTYLAINMQLIGREGVKCTVITKKCFEVFCEERECMVVC